MRHSTRTEKKLKKVRVLLMHQSTLRPTPRPVYTRLRARARAHTTLPGHVTTALYGCFIWAMDSLRDSITVPDG